MTRQYIFRFVFSLAALAVLGAYIFGPEVLAKRFDTMALGLLGLAALPWLGALVEEFKIGGVEAKLRAIREEVAEAGDAATDAREVAEELALTRLASTNVPDDPFVMDDPLMRDLEPMTRLVKPQPLAGTEPQSTLEQLAHTYVSLRESMTSSAARTARMTSLFAEMQTAAGKLGGDDITMLQWLQSDDAGHQLASIAWLRNFPAAVVPSRYVDLIERATQPFVQYWALRALSGRLSALGLDEFSIADRVALKEFESLMRAGTDRHAQIRRINRKLSGRTPL